MRQVIHDLATNGANALDEVRLLQCAVRMTVQDLGDLLLTSRRLMLEMTELASKVPEARRLQDRSSHLSLLAERIKACLEDIHHSISEWNVPERPEDPTPLVS